MPTYDYRCMKCQHEFELFHSIKDELPKRCPRCKGRAKKIPSAGGGLLFKGSGFYITDYRSSSYQEQSKKESSPEGSKEKGVKGGEKKGGEKESKPKPTTE